MRSKIPAWGSLQRNGSKFSNNSFLTIESKKGKEDAIRELTKVANTEYWPSVDLLEKRRDNKGVKAIDIDTLARANRNALAAEKAKQIVQYVLSLSAQPSGQRQKLFEIAYDAANPEMKLALIGAKEYFGKYFPSFLKARA